MDENEFAVLIASAIFTLIAASIWCLTLSRLGRRAGVRSVIALLFTPSFCLLLLLFVLRGWADPQVRNAPEYMTLFMAVGGNVLAIMAWGCPIILGMSVRDDAMERRNGAVAAVACGAMVGVTITFAGANIGSGPTIWSTLGPAFLGLSTLAVVWCLHAITSGDPEAITIDRDPAAAVRTIGFHLASSCILGNAVAGDWISSDATLHDFVFFGWPVVVLLVIAVTIDRLHWRRPWKARRRMPAALFLAAVELLITAVFIGVSTRLARSVFHGGAR